MTRKKMLATAVAAIAGLGLCGTAAAGVYSRSYLEISDLSINIQPFILAEIDNFDFLTTNTATLGGNSVIDSDGCSGTPGLGGTTNNCNSTTPRLDSQAVNANDGSSTVTRTNNQLGGDGRFALFGPGTNQYANADSVIWTATLANPPTNTSPGELTHTEQIAESELQATNIARANADIQSTTGFTFSFALADDATLTIDFNGIVDILTAIDVATGFSTGSAQADVELEFRLANDSNADGSFISWRPDGDTTTGCQVFNSLEGGNQGSLFCTQTNDEYDLNGDAGTTTNFTEDGRTNRLLAGLQDFTAIFGGLYAGDWTLTLVGKVSTSDTLTRVPEPGVIALLGIGLAAAGAARRRRPAG